VLDVADGKLLLEQTVTDADGDTDTASIDIGAAGIFKVEDDGPQLSADNLAIANVEGTFTGNFEIAVGSDVQTFAASFDSANALTWTNPRDGFSFLYDPATQTGTATFVDSNNTTQTFFTIKLNSDGTYDFNLVTPDPVTEESTGSLLAGISGGSGLESYTIDESRFGGQFKLVLTGSTDNGATAGTLTISSTDLGVNDNVMHGNKDDVLRFDVQQVNPDASVSSLTIHVATTAGWKEADQVSITVKYIEDADPQPATTQVWGSDQEVTFEFDPSKTVDYIDLTPVGNTSFKIDGVSMEYTTKVFPDDYEIGFTLIGDDADGDTASTDFSVAVNTIDSQTSTYTLTGTSEADSIYGTPGDDILVGEDGNDILIGGAGSDTITGGAGQDTIYLGLTTDADSIDGQTDTINFGQSDIASGPDTIYGFDTAAPAALGSGAGGDVLNISDLLSGTGVANLEDAVANNYISFTQDAVTGGTTVNVDTTGTGGNFQAVAILANVTFTDASEVQTMLQDNIQVV
jgi:hypothetical protein